MKRALTVGSLLLVAAAMGCAGTSPLPSESSTSAIRAAEAVGASGVPRASLHLQLAKEELDRARTLADKGHKDQAASQLLRAEADAELAVVLAKEQGEKTEAGEAMERVRQLRNDNR